MPTQDCIIVIVDPARSDTASGCHIGMIGQSGDLRPATAGPQAPGIFG